MFDDCPAFGDRETQTVYELGFKAGFDEGYRAGRNGVNEDDKVRYMCGAMVGRLWGIWQYTKQERERRERQLEHSKRQTKGTHEDTESDTEDHVQALEDAKYATTMGKVTERDRFDHDAR